MDPVDLPGAAHVLFRYSARRASLGTLPGRTRSLAQLPTAAGQRGNPRRVPVAASFFSAVGSGLVSLSGSTALFSVPFLLPKYAGGEHGLHLRVWQEYRLAPAASALVARWRSAGTDADGGRTDRALGRVAARVPLATRGSVGFDTPRRARTNAAAGQTDRASSLAVAGAPTGTRGNADFDRACRAWC